MREQPYLVSVIPNLMFATRLEDVARAQGAAVISPIDQAAFLTALRDGARGVFIDADTQQRPWPQWISAAKEDPATAAVPIIAFGSHRAVAQRQQALDAGADRYLARSNFSDGLIEIVAALLRTAEDDPCSEGLPAGAQRGIAEFNAGQYFEQHETLELVWRAERRPVRELYRGILQIGVACYQVERGNARGAIKMLDRAVKWLQPFRPVCQGVNVEQLLADAAQLRSAIERAGADHTDRVDRRRFPQVHLCR